MTLPTTVVLDADGGDSSLNAGFASEARLCTQVETARAGVAQEAMA